MSEIDGASRETAWRASKLCLQILNQGWIGAMTMMDQFTRDDQARERKLLHCGRCERQTIHNLEARCTGRWNDPTSQAAGGERYSIFRCGACDEVSYETVSWNSEEISHDEDGNPYAAEHAIQYPVPVSAHFSFNTTSIPNQLESILNEMLYSLAGSKMVLATIGLRLAVEFIVNDTKCEGSDLKTKINDLRTKDHIDDDQKELLHRIRKLGNAGAHDAKGMDTKELVAGMSIIEGLLEKLYNGPARHEATIKLAKLLLKEA